MSQSEEIQRKNKYHILMHTCEIKKKRYRLIYLQARGGDADMENRHVNLGGVMNWEIMFDLYT